MGWLDRLFGRNSDPYGLGNGGVLLDDEDTFEAYSDEGGMSAGLGSDLNVGCEGEEFAFDSYATDEQIDDAYGLGSASPLLGVDDEGELYELIGEHDETPY